FLGVYFLWAVAGRALAVFEVLFFDAQGVELAVENVFAFLEALLLFAHVLALSFAFLFGGLLDSQVFGFAIDFGLFDDFGGIGLSFGDGRGSIVLSAFQDGSGHILDQEKRNAEADNGPHDDADANAQDIDFRQNDVGWMGD